LVTRSLITGGAQHHIVKLCRELSGHDIQFDLYLLIRDEPNDLMDGLPENVMVHISPYDRHDPRALLWLSRKIKEGQINLIHSFLWTGDAYASFVRAFLYHVPLICSERGDRSLPNFYRPAKNLVDRLIPFRVADKFCSNSIFGAKELIHKGCKLEKIVTIPNGVDLERDELIDKYDLSIKQQFDDQRYFKVGIVSRLVDYKGIDVLIRSMTKLKSENVICLIAGDGPEKDNLQSLVSKLGIIHRIVFLGKVKPSEAVIKNFDVGILTTRSSSEHCSNSILEYMACGKAVIATNVAGNPEIIVDGSTGILVEPDDPDDLARAIDYLVQNPSIAHEMGIMGKARIVSNYAIGKIAAQYEELWHEVASQPK
jgi:L-malate glycosyltransferase